MKRCVVGVHEEMCVKCVSQETFMETIPIY